MTKNFRFRLARPLEVLLITMLPWSALRAEEPIKGAFGQTLGATFDPSLATRTLADSRFLSFWFPSPAGVPVFSEFSVWVSPLSYRIAAILATGKPGGREQCVEQAHGLFGAITDKYYGDTYGGRLNKLTDGSGWFLTQSKPERRIDVNCNSEGELLLRYKDTALAQFVDNEQRQLDQLQSDYAAAKYEKILPRLRELADHENLWALTMLGLMYRKGQGVTRDDEKGEECYVRAAQKGWPSAQYNLGTFYSHDFRIREAEPLLLKAAEQGIYEAELNLGQLYLAKSPLYNEQKSFAWFLRGAEHGDKEAQYNTCYDYADGIGVTRSMVEAYRWCYIAAQNGQAAAARNREHLAGQMQPGEVAQGRAEAERWLAEHTGK